MEIARTVSSVPVTAKRRILAPTMGALHRGHGELIRIARQAAGPEGEVAVSIFVNPLQFAPGGDYAKYPRPEADDEEFCRKAGVDILFRPGVEEMYASDFSMAVDETSLSHTLEGKSRPGHFRGVCTVVAKLFHLLSPTAAVFGEKDFQQLAIIRRMVRDLNFPVRIVVGATVREPDGLALSSRNSYLDPAERQAALVLSRALAAARGRWDAGERDGDRLRAAMQDVLAAEPLAHPDYVSVADPESLVELGAIPPGGAALASLAVRIGRGTRLIDNLLLEP
ncbi:MAG: pantoate--beta-alanine ligase [Chthoniobacterales bacterium]|nr:MAG: pantoate--beta-alanine ligase [Chthoniobacterales bacterium]